MNVNFASGARGPHEAGQYKFWIIKGAPFDGPHNALVIRTKTTVWDRIEKLSDEQRQWVLDTGVLIRRANLDQVRAWCESHYEDARFVMDERLLPNG